MIVIRSHRLGLESGTGPRVMSWPFYFDHDVRDCWVALSGYRVGYDDDDHHVQTISVELTCAVRDTEFGRGVVVEATALLRDDDGDAPFSGWVDFILFVDLADRPHHPGVFPSGVSPLP